MDLTCNPKGGTTDLCHLLNQKKKKTSVLLSFSGMSPVHSLLKGLQYIYSVINPLNHKSCRVFHTVYACALGNAAMLCLATYLVEKDIKSFVKFSRLCYYGSLVLFSRDRELDLLWMTENVTTLTRLWPFFICSNFLRRRCKWSTLLFYTLLIKAVTSP